MRKSLKILDEFDKEENIYQLILNFADKAHKILAAKALSGSDEVSDILGAVLKEIEEEKLDGEHQKFVEKDGRI